MATVAVIAGVHTLVSSPAYVGAGAFCAQVTYHTGRFASRAVGRVLAHVRARLAARSVGEGEQKFEGIRLKEGGQPFELEVVRDGKTFDIAAQIKIPAGVSVLGLQPKEVLNVAEVTLTSVKARARDVVDESIVTTTPFVKATEVPKGVVRLVFQDAQGKRTDIGGATRFDSKDKSYFLAPRHILESKDKVGYRPTVVGSTVTLVSSKKEITAAIKSVVVVQTKYRSAHASDAALYEVDPSLWAAIGVKSATCEDISPVGEGAAYVTAYKEGGYVNGQGTVTPSPTLETRRGIIPHTCNTIPGFSGYPVMVNDGGKRRIVAMHVAGAGNQNFAVTAPALLALLRAAEILPRARYGFYFRADDESKDKRRKQHEWEQRLEEEEDRQRVEEDFINTYSELTNAPALGVTKSALKFASKSGLNWADMSDESRNSLQKIVEENELLSSVQVAEDQSPSMTPILDGKGFTAARTVAETKPFESFPWKDKKDVHDTLMKMWVTTGDTRALLGLVKVNPLQLMDSPWFSQYKAGYHDAFGYEFKPPAKQSKAYTRDDGRVMASRVGTANVRGQPNKPGRKLPDEVKEILKEIGAPEAANYELPPTGPDAVRASLKAQLKGKLVGDLEEVLSSDAKMAILKEHCEDWAEFHFEPDLAIAIDAYLNTVEPQSSSGWTAHAYPGNKGVWKLNSDDGLTNKCDLLLYLAQCRVALLFAASPFIDHLSPIDMVRLGLRDPVVPFVKNEGLKEDKILEERYRLIWNISILDNTIHFWAYNNSNKADLARYVSGEHPSHSMGMGHHDEGIQKLGAEFDRLFAINGELVASDAKAFDLSVTREFIYLDGERRFRKALVQNKAVYGILTKAISATISSSVLSIDKGLLQLEDFGVTQSGLQVTTTMNSFIRGAGLRLAGADAALCQSDDAVHVGAVDYGFLQKMGVQTKKPKDGGPPPTLTNKSKIDFTSHLYKRSDNGEWTAEFLNIDKMLAHAYFRTPPGMEPKVEMLTGMLYAVRNTPQAYQQFIKFAEAMQWDLSDVVPQDVEWE